MFKTSTTIYYVLLYLRLVVYMLFQRLCDLAVPTCLSLITMTCQRVLAGSCSSNNLP